MVHEQQKQTSDRTFLQLIHGWLQAINSQSVNNCCAYQAVDSGELSEWNINGDEILKTFFYWILKFWVFFAPAGLALFKPRELPKSCISFITLPRFWWNREHTRPWTTSGHRKSCFSFNVLFNYSLTARGVQMEPCRTQLLGVGHIEVHGGELYKTPEKAVSWI